MLSSLLLLGCACLTLAQDGFVKLDFEREYVKEITKRQVASGDLDENVTLAEGRSVSLVFLACGVLLIFPSALLAGSEYWDTTTTIPSAT